MQVKVELIVNHHWMIRVLSMIMTIKTIQIPNWSMHPLSRYMTIFLINECFIEGKKFYSQLQRDMTPVTIALSPREIRIIKCNGNLAKLKKHNLYALHPEYLSQIVVLGLLDKMIMEWSTNVFFFIKFFRWSSWSKLW